MSKQDAQSQLSTNFQFDAFSQVRGIRGEEALGPQAILEKGQGNAPSNLDILSLATPIDLSVLEWELASYVSPDRDCILDGFKNGFSLQYTGPQIAIDTKISSRQMICHI